MNTLHGSPGLVGSSQYIMNVNSANDQNSLIGFDFPSNFGTQSPIARVYFARFQRAPKGSNHSATGSGHDIIDGCGVRFAYFVFVNPVVFCNRPMDAERDGFLFPGEIRQTQRACAPVEMNV